MNEDIKSRANTPESSAAQGAMPYLIEDCGCDGKERFRIYDQGGNGICYAQNREQAENVVSLLTQPSDATTQQSAVVIQLALDRIDRVQKRDGGPLWHTAKDILKGDLDLIAEGLRNYEAQLPRVDLTDEQIVIDKQTVHHLITVAESKLNLSSFYIAVVLHAKLLLANTAQGKP